MHLNRGAKVALDGNSKAQRAMNTTRGLLQALKERVETQNKGKDTSVIKSLNTFCK